MRDQGAERVVLVKFPIEERERADKFDDYGVQSTQ